MEIRVDRQTIFASKKYLFANNLPFAGSHLLAISLLLAAKNLRFVTNLNQCVNRFRLAKTISQNSLPHGLTQTDSTVKVLGAQSTLKQ